MSVRIAVVDSGVHAAHPHVNGIAGGIAILPDGREDSDFTDRLGHGTAVAAVIREKAPESQLFAVKIFHRSLAAQIGPLACAIEWSVRHSMDLINLSLGTSNPAHEPVLREIVGDAARQGCRIVAAGEDAGVHWLPGSIEGVIPVELDWECPRGEYRTHHGRGGRLIYRASGYPRPIPGVPPERNLKGLSFAVANVTGLLAASCSGPGMPGPYSTVA
jgi:subtilisin family serine protease